MAGKPCCRCHETKPLTDFYPRKDAKDGRGPYCKPCRKSASSANWRSNGEYRRRMVFSKRMRLAKAQGLPASIRYEDIDWPSHCPVLGLELNYEAGTGAPKDNAPSLDKIRPELGYAT